MMSSASKPACSRQGMSKARTASRISGNCGIRSSGDVRPVRLVFGIEIGAEGLLRLVEHHREVGRPLLRLHVVQQLPQHVAEAEHGVDLQAVRLAGERRQRVVGAEDVARAVDQEDVVALFEGTDDRGGLGGGFGGRGLCGRGLAAGDLDLAGMARMWAWSAGFGNARVHRRVQRGAVRVIRPAAWRAIARRTPSRGPGRPLEQEARKRVPRTAQYSKAHR